MAVCIGNKGATRETGNLREALMVETNEPGPEDNEWSFWLVGTFSEREILYVFLRV